MKGNIVQETPSREDVINAWKPISAQGFGDPAEIVDPKSQETLKAEQLYNDWYNAEKDKLRTPEEQLRFSFDTTMLYVEAGFIGSDYLDEVANDWLAQDAQAAEDQGFTELATQIRAKIDEINQRMGSK
ncbi:MAG TPA: hypothetical protein VMR76_02270 [Candidatus Saccharimonadia bacterium]|nr:hypothetical protein [Candidatus Saccharimonadia bacterium]